MTVQHVPDRIADEHAIRRVVDLLGKFADDHEAQRFVEICTPDIVFEAPDTRLERLDDLIARSRWLSTRFAALQHVIINPLIEIDGDRASARANLLATHVHLADRPDLHFDVGGIYHFGLRRIDGRWLIDRLRVQLVWTNGTFDAPERPA